MPHRKSRPGRRPVCTIPNERRRHLLVLSLRTQQKWPVALICRQLDISRRTVSLWCVLAKSYPEAATRESLAGSADVAGAILRAS
jgi:hypothetical protein